MIKTTQSQDKLQNNLTKRRQDLWNRIINEKENLNIDQGSICVDSLIDILLALFDDCKNIEAGVNENIATFLTKYQPSINKIRALRLNKYDFQVLKKLAKGHFGTVSVVRNKLDNRIYAMKTLNKMYLLRCKELSFFMEEKEVLSLSKYSPWIPKLYAAFQDSENLYLVMEFAGGGDLFSLLDRNYPPIINEEEAKFYIGEIVLALSDLHSMGFVHRDLKPQNILIDNQGHIKLADFGSCIQLNNQSSVTSNIPVGTSDYISPEVLRAQEGNTNYGVECDWWSVGVLIYELLQGDPPFSSENLMETHSQIMNHKNNLMFHGIYPISEEARDLIEKLICDREVRLGKNGVEEIKSHPFFRGINWNSLRNQTPPFIPTLLTPDDTSNFNGYEDEEDTHEVKVVPRSNQKEFMGDHLPFVGFTYQQEDIESLKVNDRVETEMDESAEIKQNSVKLEMKLAEIQTDLTMNELDDSLSTIHDFSSVTLKNNDETNVSIMAYEAKIKELQEKVVSLNAGLQSCQETIQSQMAVNQGLMMQADNIRDQLMESESEKNEMSRLLEAVQKKMDEEDKQQDILIEENKRLLEGYSNSQAEVKKLKKAITELSMVHQDMKQTTLSLDQSREQADNNFLIMKDKCENLQYENQHLNKKVQDLENKLPTINSDDITQLKNELSESVANVTRLNKELEITKETNKFLLKEIEELSLKNKSNEDVPNKLGVAIDNKLFQDIIANLELETKNHHLLTSIYQDLQEQKGLQPSLIEVKESRDEAVERADQMLHLNEKQANLIKTLMEKITYLESNQPQFVNHSNNKEGSIQFNQYGRDGENKIATLIIENQNLKAQLAFKDQKLQEIVTKLVVAEATKPSFWPKSKEKSKERQKVLLHTIQALEQKLRLVERENAQLRFIKQLSQIENSSESINLELFNSNHNNSSSPLTNSTRFSTQSSQFQVNLDTGRFTHLTIEDNTGIKVRNGPSTSIEKNNHMGTLSLNQSILTERSLSSKFGISHIK